MRELKLNHPPDEPLVLAIACNKADLADQRVVPWETAQQYAESIGALIYETSAKSNTGVSQLFTDVARRLISTKSRSGGDCRRRITSLPPARAKGHRAVKEMPLISGYRQIGPVFEALRCVERVSVHFTTLQCEASDRVVWIILLH